MKSVELTEESIKRYDCLLIAANHLSYNYKWILKMLILRYRNLNTFAEGHFLKEPYIFRKAILIAYSRHLNEASERRKKKDLLFEE